MFSSKVTRLLGTAAFAAAVATFAASTPGAAQDNSKPIIIGSPISMTGPSGAVGVDLERGSKLAVEEINAAGGVLGRKLEIVIQDTTGAPAQAVQLLGAFARNPDVVAILGPVNAAEVGAVTNLAQSNQIVVFAPASAGTVPGVPDLKFNDWTFRLNQAQPTVLGPLLKEVARLENAKSVTILNYSDSATHVDIGNFWEKAAQDNGLTVQRIQFPTALQDYSAIVTQIKQDTELVAIGAHPATYGPLIRAIRQAGIKAPFMGDAGILASSVYTVSQGASKGAYAYSSYIEGFGTGTDKFIEAYRKAYNTEPSALVAYGYEGVKLIAHALETKKEVSRQAVRDGLGETKDYPGITGNVSYNNSGDAVRQTVPLVQADEGGVLKKVSDIPLQQ